MSKRIAVTSAATLSNSFVGNTAQVCVVTSDYNKTINGFLELGIGPWASYTFGPGTVTHQTYMGRTEAHSMRLALATSGNMLWEVIQPLDGPSIYKDFLVTHGEGVHHVAFGCEGLPFERRIEEFEKRGCRKTQSGLWVGCVPYAYFETEGLISTTVEIFDFPPGFQMPAPEEWIPGPPTA
ncbi:MAG TPA: VOC family protein [Steroidobacteraceae bacterium]|nr:VOC family protein [Steroidobacteraceae bacterium]